VYLFDTGLSSSLLQLTAIDKNKTPDKSRTENDFFIIKKDLKNK
jgi:hypothetical protein